MVKIIVTGLRGIPHLQGGVEKHCEQLYPILAEKNYDIEVIGRSPFLNRSATEYKGVQIRRLYAPDPSFKGLEAFVNTLIGVLYAGIKRPDILHIHAVGPALFTPLAKLLGLKVIVTHHGFDYGREKWGRVGKAIISSGERLGMKFADKVIVISEQIKRHVQEKYHVESVKIPNGVVLKARASGMETLNRYHLKQHRYFLMVSRFVPEKRQDDLIRAFIEAKIEGWKLVFVGGISPSDDYIIKIQNIAKQNRDILLTGFLTGQSLEELYANAGCFVLPSSHEGLPIAVLEAMSYGRRILASDIEANLEIGLDPESYFSLGNVRELARKMRGISESVTDMDEVKAFISQAASYSWESIAEKTHTTYQALLKDCCK